MRDFARRGRGQEPWPSTVRGSQMRGLELQIPRLKRPGRHTMSGALAC